MRKTVIIDVVGLTPGLLADFMPRLSEWANRGRLAVVQPVMPAVTCSVQATYFTGKFPDEHGIVGNGWYFRDECEVRFWRQSNKLVQAPKVWEQARAFNPSFTCANLFGWYNMYSSVDVSVTPRPMYPADGRKIPDIYTQPAELRDELQKKLGRFPLFDFWGPRASIRSSRWIAEAARLVEQEYHPTLTIIYLPHLDYDLQRFGPGHPVIRKACSEIDTICSDLIDDYERQGADVMILSEYGITQVSAPVHINRVLRQHGLLAVREELGRELLDAGASAAFAVADHQIAHVYVNDASKLNEIRLLLENTPGIGEVLDNLGKSAYRLNHPRAGDLVAIASRGAWFTYYYWLDDRHAPDFACCVDIHRKPGYDPAELLLDPALRFPQLKIARALLKKWLGFRYLMDVIPLDAGVVRGSHGRPPDAADQSPVLITQRSDLLSTPEIGADKVCSLILRHLDLPSSTAAEEKVLARMVAPHEHD